MSEDEHGSIRVPNAALLALLVTISAWWLTVFSVLARGHLVLTLACASLSVGTTVYLSTVGWRAAAPYWQYRRRIAVAGWQALLVVLFVVSLGCFGAWVMMARNGDL